MQAEDYRKVPEVGLTNPTIDVLRTSHHPQIRGHPAWPQGTRCPHRRSPSRAHLILPPAVLNYSHHRCGKA